MFPPPTFHHERELYAKGYTTIVGVDEVGSGAIAGPVVAAAVLLPLKSRLSGIRDSKLLSSSAREKLAADIQRVSPAWSVALAEIKEIHALGIRQATYLAMRRAIAGIPSANFALVDAWTIPELPMGQRGIIHGDRLVKSIAAASIIAKVERDFLMVHLAKNFPDYGFEAHKGYATAFHKKQLKKYGKSPIHRNWKIC
jgi:ribonuclease HII